VAQPDSNLPSPDELPTRAPEARVGAGEDHSGTDRLRALADGLFAVVMTLLVLDLKLPIPDSTKVPDSDIISLTFGNDEFVNKLLLYIVTFLIAGIYWYSHVLIMRRLKRIDEGMVWLSLAFFLFITFLPFTSNLFAQVGQDGHPDLGINTILIYSGNNLIAGSLLILLWFYVSKRQRLISNEVKPYEIPSITIKIAIFPFIALCSILAALLLGPGWGLLAYYILPAPLNTIQGIVQGRAKQRHEGQ
jgi:uncharacterized membrane protein